MSVYTISLNIMKLDKFAILRFTPFAQVSSIQWTDSITTLVEWLEYFFSKTYIVYVNHEWLSDKEYLGLNLKGSLSVVPGVALKVLIVARSDIENTWL